MKKRILCGSAAILLTGLTAAMFSLAASHTRELAIQPDSYPADYGPMETVVVERDRYLARTGFPGDVQSQSPALPAVKHLG